MLQTFSQIKASPVLNVAGVDPNSKQFIRFVNEATERLLNRGDWHGTVVPVHLCVKRGCVVMPRWVGSIRKLAVCKTPIDIRNNWFSFFNHADWNGFAGGECGLTGPTPTCVFQDILGDGRALRIYTDYAADVGKSITIFGKDNNGQPLRTQNADGSWSEGMKLTLSVPWTDSTTTVRKITRVVKDATQGNVRIYAGHPNYVPKGSVYDATRYFYINSLTVGKTYSVISDGSEFGVAFGNGTLTTIAGHPAINSELPNASNIFYVTGVPVPFVATGAALVWVGKGAGYSPVTTRVYDDLMEEVATYEPTQVNPEFSRYQLKVPGCSDCASILSVVALVKVKFVPVESDNDLVLISNMTALKLMVQSIQDEEGGNDAAASSKEAKAIRELNLELSNAQPDDQIPVDLGETGGTWIGTQRCY